MDNQGNCAEITEAFTGGFGGMGRFVLEEALRRGHATSVLEMESKRNRKVGRHFEKRLAGVHWGDILDHAFLDRAVDGQDMDTC